MLIYPDTFVPATSPLAPPPPQPATPPVSGAAPGRRPPPAGFQKFIGAPDPAGSVAIPVGRIFPRTTCYGFSALDLKRFADFLLAGVGLLIVTPVMLLAAAAIKLESPGPVLFRQRRVGRYHRPFEMLKLRSMYCAPSAAASEARWTQPGDRRITRVGRILRRFHLDELPQFWNVLQGEMSLIGPRPEQIPIADRLSQNFPVFALRHLVRPGITGWAQVHTGYCASDDESITKLKYDLFYLCNMSPWLDLEILLRTLIVVMKGKGCR